VQKKKTPVAVVKNLLTEWDEDALIVQKFKDAFIEAVPNYCEIST
jgi:hypothetical protein